MVKKKKDSLDLNSKKIVDLLLDKSALKQDVFEYTLDGFNKLKDIAKNEIAQIKPYIPDARIRLFIAEKGQNEFHAYVGSDVLVYQAHSNVFRLEDNHPLWKTDYLKGDSNRGFFGIIHIYNFLADSFLQNRHNDVGHLIGRIYINKDGKFFTEGNGQLGFLFKDLTEGEWEDAAILHIIQVSFAFAITSDLFVPPYEMMEQLNVEQVQTIGYNSQSAVGKRLGFKFKSEDDE